MAKTKKFPTGESLAVTNKAKDGTIYYITQNSTSGLFFLYKELPDKSLDKIGKGLKNPLDFDEIIWP